MQPESSCWVGDIICLGAIFIPSFLLILGALPFWVNLREMRSVRNGLMGVNAAVVGLLLAVFYDPVWSGGIHSSRDFVLGLIAFCLLSLWKVPPWLVVLVTAIGSAALNAF